MQKSNDIPTYAAEYHLNQYQHNVPRFSVHEIDNYLKKYDKKRRKAHAENHYQIIWFKKGSGRYFVNLKAYDIDENTLFFLTKNDLHYFDRNTHYKGVLIQFNEEFLIQNNDNDFFFKQRVLESQLQSICSLKIDDVFFLDEYLNLIKNELTYKNETSHIEILRCYLRVFIAQVLYRWEKSTAIYGYQILPDNKRQTQLVKFVELVEENYKKELKVSDYARLMQLSSRTLSGLTSKLLDKSPSEIINQRIIAEAQRMLMDNNYTISKIGLKLGFNDDSYFVKYFKKHTGRSPLDFRRLNI
ncbi:AraC family transcriptional regulator [Flavobacterium zhairuonense]|uniref:AraC family transcriptional regulator n=1 Tax=Flavobacterium zhairuonense TaxID=2493631 RepID=UPI00104D2885|nr:AraC family transcriptional regulator [Flavobacterium zhairuonense]KAF2508693.1 AraC family transcriptional regulator [Flavobacterium zhairuonense]